MTGGVLDVAVGVLGAACSGTEPCAFDLVCVDGVCHERPWPPAPVTPSPVRPEPIDLDAFLGGGPDDEQDVLGDADDATGLDGASDADADQEVGPDADAAPALETDADPGGLPDAVAADAAVDTADATGEVPDAPADVGVGVDTPEAGPTDVVPDVGEPDAGPDPDKIVLLLGEDSADLAFGTSKVVLALGQGWATDLTLPLPGLVIGMEVVVVDPYDGASCAVFRPAVWVYDEDGSVSDAPTWMSAAPQVLQGDPAPQAFLLPEKVPVPEGKVRFGLVLETPCDGEPPAPVLATDDSGDVSRTWLYAPQPAAGAWVSGDFLGVDGRWALRVLLEVSWPAP